MSAVAAPPGPYKGLSAFDDTEVDALLFFGRGRERDSSSPTSSPRA